MKGEGISSTERSKEDVEGENGTTKEESWGGWK